MRKIMRPTHILFALLVSFQIALAGNIEHVGDWHVSGFYEKPVIVGNTAYIANVYGVIALDVSNPLDIIELGYQPGMGYSYGLDVSGDIAYLANWEDDLLVVDFTDPFNPVLLEQIPLSGEVWDVDISEPLAAVACGAEGVYILDISNPADPEVHCNFGIGDFAVDVLLEGDWVFVAAWDSGAFCYNITDPANPWQVDFFTDNLGQVRDLDYSSLGYLYLAEENYGLEVLVVDYLGNMALVYGTPSLDYFNVEVDGNRLYACAGLDGMRVYDISTPSLPVLSHQVSTEGEAWATFIQPDLDLLYLADGPDGLLVYDTNSGEMPIFLGQYENLGQVVGVAAEGDTVYFTAKQDGLQIYELLGSNLVWRGLASTPDSARSVTLSNTIAYVACGVAGVAVYDKSSPYIPLLLTTVNTPGFASRVNIYGDTAWVADGASGVAVIDVSDPATASYIDNVLTQDDALGLSKSGDLLYVAEAINGLTIYNVANLDTPLFEGGIYADTTFTVRDVILYGQYALVAAFEAGFRIVDISVPANPIEAAYIDLPGHATRILLDSTLAYVTLHDEGLAVVDLTDPLNPVLNAYHESPGSGVDITLIGDQIILADTYCIGLYNFDAYAGVQRRDTGVVPQEFALAAAFPNPFNASTVLSFTLPKPAFVDLKIYDVQGRVVADLVEEHLLSGAYQVHFEGVALSSGVYLARLKADSYITTQKLVLLK